MEDDLRVNSVFSCAGRSRGLDHILNLECGQVGNRDFSGDQKRMVFTLFN